MSNSRLSLCAFVAICLGPSFALATSPFDEVSGVRTLGMGGAHRAVGTSNDTLKLNPAGLAIHTRYAVELHYGWSEKYDESRATVSAVDSKSGPVAGGLGYEFLKSELEGNLKNLHRVSLGLAYRLGDMLALGTTVHYIEGSRDVAGENEDVREFSSDLGFIFRLSDHVQLGATWHNLVRSENTGLSPQSVGLGFSAGGSGFLLAYDSRLDLEQDEIDASHHVGMEYVFGRTMPFRVGYENRPRIKPSGEELRENFMGGGFGYFSKTGSIDISFNHSLERARVWTVLGALLFYL